MSTARTALEDELARACLLVMMQPPADFDAEFNDWYDTDHLPERLAVPGFLAARRYECSDGWPRYLALYDLADAAVLGSPDYLKVAEGNYTNWTRRVLKRVRVLRHALTLHAPDDADTTDAPRLVLIRFSGIARSTLPEIWSRLTSLRGGLAEIAQVRLMIEAGQDTGFALLELRSPLPTAALGAGAFGALADRIDLWNLYSARPSA